MSPSFFIEKTRSREKADERELLLFIDGIVDELSLVLGKKKIGFGFALFFRGDLFCFSFFFFAFFNKSGRSSEASPRARAPPRPFSVDGGIRIGGATGGLECSIEWQKGAEKRMTSSAIINECSIDDDGNAASDDGSGSFSFASTALALSCDELPNSPCLRVVRGSKVRDWFWES